MTALKLLTQSAIAGLYGGAVVARLVAILNGGETVVHLGPAMLSIALVYALAAAIFWTALYGALRFFASGSLNPSWLSLRYIVGFHVANLACVLASAWVTQSRVREVIEPGLRGGVISFCLGLTAAWLWSLAVTVVPGWRHRQWTQVSAVVVSVVALGLPVPTGGGRTTDVPLEGRRPPGASAAGRVLILNFDGADLDTVLALRAEGKLPNFDRLAEEGSYGRLKPIRPCRAAVARTTLMTGKLPHRHGVRSDFTHSLPGGAGEIDVVPVGIGFDLLLWPLVETRPNTIADRRSLALWEIVALMGGAGEPAGWEIDLDRPETKRLVAQDPPVRGELSSFLDADMALADDPLGRARVEDLATAVMADGLVLRRLETEMEGTGPGIVAVSFPGMDRVAHMYLRFAQPGRFGDVTAREIELYGDVLERYYRRMDEIVGRVLAELSEEATLVVTSSHGIEPLPFGRRLLVMALGRAGDSGSHDRGPQGFLFVRGPHIQAGATFGRASLLDLVPTVLYALNLPVARDMDGRILAGIFTPVFKSTHPVTVIGSYERGAG